MPAPLGLGLAALGRPGYVTLNHATDLGGSYDPASMETHAHAVLDAAFDGGIRYIDAARSYGRAEDFVASWLRKRAIKPQQLVIASKWGYTYTAGWSTIPDDLNLAALLVMGKIRQSRKWGAMPQSQSYEEYSYALVNQPDVRLGLLSGEIGAILARYRVTALAAFG